MVGATKASNMFMPIAILGGVSQAINFFTLDHIARPLGQIRQGIGRALYTATRSCFRARKKVAEEHGNVIPSTRLHAHSAAIFSV